MREYVAYFFTFRYMNHLNIFNSIPHACFDNAASYIGLYFFMGINIRGKWNFIPIQIAPFCSMHSLYVFNVFISLLKLWKKRFPFHEIHKGQIQSYPTNSQRIYKKHYDALNTMSQHISLG